MANILSDQYKSVFSKPKDDISTLQFLTANCTPLNDIDILDADIIEAINDINSYSAPGPDGIPAAFYKDSKKN